MQHAQKLSKIKTFEALEITGWGRNEVGERGDWMMYLLRNSCRNDSLDYNRRTAVALRHIREWEW